MLAWILALLAGKQVKLLNNLVKILQFYIGFTPPVDLEQLDATHGGASGEGSFRLQLPNVIDWIWIN